MTEEGEPQSDELKKSATPSVEQARQFAEAPASVDQISDPRFAQAQFDSAAKAFDAWLLRAWRAAGLPARPSESSVAWVALRGAFSEEDIVAAIGEELTVYQPAGSPLLSPPGAPVDSSGGIDGDLATVHVLVRSLAQQLSPPELIELISARLVATIARLESESDLSLASTRENLVDIAVAALRPLPGPTRVRTPELEIFPYLTAAGEAGAEFGFFVTAATLGAMRADPKDSIQAERAFMIEYSLRQTARLLETSPPELSLVRTFVSQNIGNMATSIWLLGSGGQPVRDAKRAGELKPLIDEIWELKKVQAAAAPLLEIAPNLAEVLLKAFALPSEDALDTITAVGEAGSPPAGLWVTTNLFEHSRLSAATAVIRGLGSDPARVTAGLFNAAILLDRNDRAAELETVKTRLLLYLCALHWALSQTEPQRGNELGDAMVRLDGLDIVVNLLGDIAQYVQRPATAALPWDALRALAAPLGAVPAALGLDQMDPDAARIFNSTERLGATATAADAELGNLRKLCQDGLDALDPQHPADRRELPPILDERAVTLAELAWLIGSQFEALCGKWDEDGWGGAIRELTKSRLDPLQPFTAMFAGDSPSPAVESGAVIPDAWNAIEARLAPNGQLSLADILARFVGS